MKLLEHKGKELLKACGINVPPGIVVDNKSYINLSYHKERFKQFFYEQKEVVIKAQIIAKQRKKNNLIVEPKDYPSALQQIDGLYNKQHKGTHISTLLIEKKIQATEEFFLAILYDTTTRKPMVVFSKEGGIDIEDTAKTHKPIMKSISAINGLQEYEAREIVKAAGCKDIIPLSAFLKKAYACFEKYECRILEINPIMKTAEGIYYAGDAKITIDDNAVSRLDAFHDLTDMEDESLLNEREREARRIDVHDYRGVAGKTFIDLDGDIAVLASGGGASLTCMDTIIEAGGKPANYTEYSGNPPREKVKKLTILTLSKPSLNGCLVIGGRANFTDILETLSGFADGLKQIAPKPTYPIIIRRAGPNDKKAFEMLRELAKKEGYDITLYGEEMPLTKAAHLMVQKVGEYKARRKMN